MDDLMNGLSEFLSTEEGQNTVNMLKGMLSGKAEETPDSTEPAGNDEISGQTEISQIVKAMSLLKNARADESTEKLLLAIKPHLSKERQARVDGAVKLLKLGSVVPLLKESNILSDLL